MTTNMHKLVVTALAALCLMGVALGAAHAGSGTEALAPRVEDELLSDGLSLARLGQRVELHARATSVEVTLVDLASGKPVASRMVDKLPADQAAAIAQLTVVVADMLRARGITASPKATSGSSAESTAATACFPTCRAGYLCSPTGTCVSECNPGCGDRETCSSGRCIATVDVALPARTQSPSDGDPDRDLQMALRASGVYQYWKIAGSALGTYSGIASGESGVAVGFEVSLPRLHLLVIPRFAAVFATKTQVEVGADVGARFAKSVSRGRIGLDVLFTPMLFPGVAPHSKGFYYGGRGELFFERGRVRVLAGFGYGHIATFSPDATVDWYELGVGYLL